MWDWTKAKQRLLKTARKVAHYAYCPYSGLAVGCAVMTKRIRYYAGCNVENASFGLSICAERNAIAAAATDGMFAGDLEVVCIYTEGEKHITPCGACLQVIAEFASDDCLILCAAKGQRTIKYKLKDLLPEAFEFPPEQLET